MGKQDKDGRSTGAKGLMGWSAVAMLGALAVAAVGALVSYWLMTGSCILDAEGRRPKDVSDAIRIGLTLAAGVGAAVALVVAFRRQKVLEEDREGKRADDAADREVQRALHERYQAATAQLGHDNLTMRLAGVFALAAVADDWLARGDRGQAQVCVDVLCSYQRTGGALEKDGSQLDVEVRQTITRVVAAHLQPNASKSWGGLDFDFTGAAFTGTHDFSDAVFSGGLVSFEQADFAGEAVSFDRAVFSGGVVSFARATFSNGYATFFDTAFSGGKVTFLSARFKGTEMVFFRSKFAGAEVEFSNATVNLSELHFTYAEFSKGQVQFDGVNFKDGEVSFYSTQFSGGGVTFQHGLYRPVEPADGGGVVTGPWPGPPDPLPNVWPLPADGE